MRYDSGETCMKQYQQFIMAHNCEDLLANMYYVQIFCNIFLDSFHKIQAQVLYIQLEGYV